MTPTTGSWRRGGESRKHKSFLAEAERWHPEVQEKHGRQRFCSPPPCLRPIRRRSTRPRTSCASWARRTSVSATRRRGRRSGRRTPSTSWRRLWRRRGSMRCWAGSRTPTRTSSRSRKSLNTPCPPSARFPVRAPETWRSSKPRPGSSARQRFTPPSSQRKP